MTSETKISGTTHLTIREIVGADEMHAVEKLQKDVWGFSDLDVVPLTQLVAAVHAGGVVLGAFDGKTLAGFAYGFAGLEHGRVTHHSHMLAVDSAYRNSGIGYRLKLAQRDFALGQGISEMTWTFDPIQSLNAYFNFSRLGVVSDRYLVDFYGSESGSFLHRNGTDRLWVTWRLSSAAVEERLLDAKPIYPVDRAGCLLKVADNDCPAISGRAPNAGEDIVLIEIPTDIAKLKRRDTVLAQEWRSATRRVFVDAFAAGFVAVDFSRITNEANKKRVGRYVLTREKTP